MTRPTRDQQRARTGRPTEQRARASAGSRSVGPSSLWADEKPSGRPQPLRASWNPVPAPPAAPRAPRVPPKKSAHPIASFIRRHGWRAYAIPVLFVLSIVVVVQISQKGPADAGVATSTGSSSAGRSAGQAAGKSAVGTATNGTGSQAAAVNANFPSGVLPVGAAFQASGDGTWHVVPGATSAVGTGPTKYTYEIKVEDEVGDAAADQQFAATVDATLADQRSWIGSGKYTFQRVDSGTPSFTIALTSQMTTRQPQLCGWAIPLENSCYAAGSKQIVINDARWARGSVASGNNLAAYQAFAINHEVGHALGLTDQPCTGSGAPAPAMMQQSWSLADNDLSPLTPTLIPMDGKVCTFNPYPFPQAEKAAGATSASSAAAGAATSSGG